MSPFLDKAHLDGVRRRLAEKGHELTPDQLLSEVDGIMGALAGKTGMSKEQAIQVMREIAALSTIVKQTLLELLDEHGAVPVALFVQSACSEEGFGSFGVSEEIVRRAIRSLTDEGAVVVVGEEIRKLNETE